MQPFTILRDPETGRCAIRSDRPSGLPFTALCGDHRFLDEADVAGWEHVGSVADLLAAAAKAREVVDADRFGFPVSGAVRELARVLPAEEEAA